MADEVKRDGAEPKDAGRRALLKAATVAGGAVAASALLPGSWKKPVATIGGLPAHAQTSQTITLTRPEARNWPFQEVNGLGEPPNGVESEIIYTRSDYEDALGDFGPDHEVTVQVVPLATAAVGDVSCEATYRLGDLKHEIMGTKTAGTVYFAFKTSCVPPGRALWRIHKGSHVSNLVNTSVRLD